MLRDYPAERCGMCGQLIKISYEQRKPEVTKLYQIISAGWKKFLWDREQEGRSVPKYIVEEFESYLRCGILAYGFGRLHSLSFKQQNDLPCTRPRRRKRLTARSAYRRHHYSLPRPSHGCR